MRTGKGFAALHALERLVQGGNIVGVLLEVPVLRIHDILVWIRIRMRSADPCLWLMDPDPDSDPDPDPSIFIIDLQDANKKIF